MKAFVNLSGEIVIAMTYPEAELLLEIVGASAIGSGCHRGAIYVEQKLCRAISPIVQEAINAVEKLDQKEEDSGRKTKKKRQVGRL